MQWYHGSSFDGKASRKGSDSGCGASSRGSRNRRAVADEVRWKNAYGKGVRLGGRDASSIPWRELRLLGQMELTRVYRRLERSRREDAMETAGEFR